MDDVLVFGAAPKGHLLDQSLEAIAAAQQLARGMGLRLVGGLIGNRCGTASAILSTAGLSKLLVMDDPSLELYASDSYTAAALAIVRKCDPAAIIFPHTSEIVEWVPALAARLDAASAMACTKLWFDGDRLYATRLICGGAVEAEYAFNRPLGVATIAPGAYAPVAPTDACPISFVELPDIDPRISVIEEVVDESDADRSLKGARIVVSGGLGIGARENWHLIEDLAASLDAAIGATRSAVELGWVPAKQQVGFSGQKIRPELYIAVGISGAIHHLAGIVGAKTVVAINKDAEALIFRVARFGVVGDAKEVMPAFTARVKELREQQD